MSAVFSEMLSVHAVVGDVAVATGDIVCDTVDEGSRRCWILLLNSQKHLMGVSETRQMLVNTQSHRLYKLGIVVINNR